MTGFQIPPFHNPWGKLSVNGYPCCRQKIMKQGSWESICLACLGALWISKCSVWRGLPVGLKGKTCRTSRYGWNCWRKCYLQMSTNTQPPMMAPLQEFQKPWFLRFWFFFLKTNANAFLIMKFHYKRLWGNQTWRSWNLKTQEYFRKCIL